MSEMSDYCQELLDEYRALRRRLEDIDYMNPDIDDSSFSEQEQADLERLQEIKEELDDECDVDILDDDEDDIDLPEYADEAPSEPRDFDID